MPELIIIIINIRAAPIPGYLPIPILPIADTLVDTDNFLYDFFNLITIIKFHV